MGTITPSKSEASKLNIPAASGSVISENSLDVITQVDADGKILFWTPGAEKLLGYSEQEILGQSIGVLIPQDLLEKALEGIRQQFQGEIDVFHEETVCLNKRGDRIPVLLTRVPIRDNKCRIIALLAILKDLTEQQNLQKQLETLHSNTAMAKVAAKVAHEIRTPLGVLFLKSDLLVERMEFAFKDWSQGKDNLETHQGRLVKCIADIQKQISRLEEIANNYLHLSKTRTMDREEINLHRFLRDIAKELREQYPEENLSIDYQVQDGVPTVKIDSQQFHRVYVNLVKNSVEALRSAHVPKGQILLNVYLNSNQVVFEISDNGPGIPGQIMEAVFDPFTTTKSIGTGLGLYLTREIVENHGGTIEIDSEEGKGTTIRFSLPTQEKGA